MIKIHIQNINVKVTGDRAYNDLSDVEMETFEDGFFANPITRARAVTKYEGPKICFSCNKNGISFSAASCEKIQFLMQLKQIFGPSYFVTAF